MKRFLALLAVLLVAAGAHAAGKPDFLVDADWLAERLKDPKLVVLEVRYHPHRHATVGHIPGAIQVQRFADLGDNAALPIPRAWWPGRRSTAASSPGAIRRSR